MEKSSSGIGTQFVWVKGDDYILKTAKGAKEAQQLVEAGFEYVCKIDENHIFRKRK